MLAGEAVQQIRQQMDRDAEEGPDPHRPDLQPVEGGRLADDLAVLAADVPDGGQQGRALGSQVHAEAVAREELQPQLVLQAGDDVADGGLGVAQDLRGPGEAAQVRRL